MTGQEIAKIAPLQRGRFRHYRAVLPQIERATASDHANMTAAAGSA
jgi:hypothetical protein